MTALGSMPTCGRLLRGLVAALAVILLGGAPPAVSRDTGELTPRDCIQDIGRSDCAGHTQGLDEAYAVAITADGRSVYAVSSTDDAIVHFDRNLDTGALTPAGCIQDVGRTDCGVTQQGLDGPEAVAVSADGTSVYVVTLEDSAVVTFRRDTATGALTGVGCIQDLGLLDCGAMQQQGLEAADGIAVSPDGRSVYTASFTDDAVVRFDRNPTTSVLTPAGCIQDSGRLECGTTQQGLNGAGTVAVSPDGRSVYVAAYFDAAIVRFDRNPTSGALTSAGCIQDVGRTDCGPTQEGLDGAFGVAVSADGSSVYTASYVDDAVAWFARAGTNGALTPQGCVRDVGGLGCGATQQGLDGNAWVALTEDGRSAYTQGFFDDAVVRFDLDPQTGALGSSSCIQDEGRNHGCPVSQEALDGVGAVAATADGRSVYAVSVEDDAIVHFDREPHRPQTTIRKGPKRTTTKRSTRFAFNSSTPGAGFECKLDKDKFTSCTSPVRIRASLGRHTFQVRATDPAGNADATPARHRWRVLKR
jgi:DNA-binding beta-propeller fold protein YncE